MKQVNRSRRQSGFFDLGMSLLVIAIAGGVVYGVESAQQEQVAAAQGVDKVQADSQTTAKLETDMAQQ